MTAENWGEDVMIMRISHAAVITVRKALHLLLVTWQPTNVSTPCNSPPFLATFSHRLAWKTLD